MQFRNVERFTYLRSNNNKTGQAIEDKYDLSKDFENKYILRRGETGFYIVKKDDFVAWNNSLPEQEKIYHEVAIGCCKQKLRFDLDVSLDKLEKIDNSVFNKIESTTGVNYSNEEKMQIIIKTYRSAIITIFNSLWLRHRITLDNILMTRTYDPSGNKYSSHIIVAHYCVSNVAQMKYFANKMKRIIIAPFLELLDTGVYGDCKSLRLTGHHKSDTDRRVKVIVTDHTILDSLVTCTADCVLLPEIIEAREERVGNNIVLDDTFIEAALQIYRDSDLYDEHQQYRSFKRNELSFDRLESSFCHCCLKNHDNDNTLILLIDEDDNNYIVNLSCRRNYGHRLYIGTFGRDEDENEGAFVVHEENDVDRAQIRAERINRDTYTAKLIKKAIKMHDDGLLDRKTLFDTLDPALVNKYEAPNMRPYELCETLCVKAPMKLGKTKTLIEFIKQHYPETRLIDGRAPVICILSFRLTFSNELKANFEGFTLYSDIKGDLKVDRIIVQVESLHRLNRFRVPDLLILDESESIFEQFTSMLAREPDIAFQNLKWLLQYSGQVICMDACLGDRTFNILDKCRPSFRARKSIVYHYNTVKNASSNNYYLYDQIGRWMYIMKSAIDAGENIVVLTNSLTDANTVEEYIRDKFPEMGGKLYSSETPFSVKQNDFANVNANWDNLNYLIYTPTVTAGVSFEKKHYHTVFAYFTNLSCNAITCMQMLGRVRNVGTQSFHVMYQHRPQSLPVERQDIIEVVHNRHSILYDRDPAAPGAQEKRPIMFSSLEYDRNGCVRTIGEDPFLSIWVENVRINNMSKNSFVRELVKYVGDSGAKFHYMSPELFLEETGVEALDENGKPTMEVAMMEAEHSLCREIVVDRKHQLIADARELNESDAEEIVKRMEQGEDITNAENMAMEKRWLRKVYDFHHDIDKDFVSKYNHDRVKEQYRNLKLVNCKASFDESIAHVRNDESINFEYYLSGKMPASSHTRNYKSCKLSLISSLIKTCGWETIYSRTALPTNYLHNVLHERDGWLWKNYNKIKNEFNIPKINKNFMRTLSKKQYISYVMKNIISPILNETFGVLVKYRMQTDMYVLQESDLFTYDLAEVRKPYIQRGAAL